MLEERLDLVPSADVAETETSLRLPVGRLDIFPDRSLNIWPRGHARTRAVSAVGATLALHAAFALLFARLLDWRVLEQSRVREIPVEIVSRVPPTPPKVTSPPTREAQSGPPPGSSAESAALPSRPELVAPPPEPAHASGPDRPKTAEAAAPNANAVRPAPPPPVRVPESLASPRGDEPAPQPAPARPKPTDPVDLGAALPVDLSVLPTSFRAILSGSGAQVSDDYKGLVFARLGRSQGAVERARALNLRGQAYVAFSIDDRGQIAELRIAHSSGKPALDALALDMVREAAPFPPPPAGAKRDFTPALSFGDE